MVVLHAWWQPQNALRTTESPNLLQYAGCIAWLHVSTAPVRLILHCGT
jgi:hypothetical protein